MQEEMTALVIGATGLVGGLLVEHLLADVNWTRVRTFSRRPSGLQHQKLEENIVDFDSPQKWADKLEGNALFCCMGTTRKKAGGKKQQYKVDFTYQFNTAKAACHNGVAVAVVVSSVGANSSSLFFYSRMKGQLDEALDALPFCSLRVLRPSILDGQRAEERGSERIVLDLSKALLPHIPGLKTLRPIPASNVARAMGRSAFDALTNDLRKKVVYSSAELFELGKA